jgi:Glycosyltransferase
MLDALRHPNWPAGVQLLVIGAGAQQHLVQQAVQAGLPVRWLGYRPHEQIPELIAGAIAGLIPITNPRGRSSTGVSPLKLYETLACGIPVIATDLPGQAEVVRAGNCGIVIPCDDAAALAAAVATCAADRDSARAMGRRGRPSCALNIPGQRARKRSTTGCVRRSAAPPSTVARPYLSVPIWGDGPLGGGLCLGSADDVACAEPNPGHDIGRKSAHRRNHHVVWHRPELENACQGKQIQPPLVLNDLLGNRPGLPIMTSPRSISSSNFMALRTGARLLQAS